MTESDFKYFGWHVTSVSKVVLFLVTIFTLLTVIRMFYTSHPKAPRYVPESTFLTFLGIFFGALISLISGQEATVLEDVFKFNHDIFILLLVPIIIFESAYTLDKSSFFHNFTEIMTYAVFGTLANTLFIALMLNVLKRYFVLKVYETSHIFAFAALISAVDPVSVMAVMIDLKVNRNLYNMSFGESVLNDGVSIVLYTLFSKLDVLQKSNYSLARIVGAGILKFIISVGFALLIGTSITFAVCFILKYKKNKLKYLEPFLALICAYGTFQFADSLLFSGIISIIISGMLLSRYSEPNWAHSSVEAMHITMKMFASSFEALIFFDMGMQISFLTRDKIGGKSQIDYWFLLFSLGLVLVARTLSVLIFTAFLNIRRKARNETIPMKEQFIMIMAGLRGAISFALSTALVEVPKNGTTDEKTKAINIQNNIIFTTCIIILFTIVIQGLPLGFFIKKLRIAREKEYFFSTPLDCHRIDLSILSTDLVFQQTLLAIDAIGWNKGMINSWSQFVQKFDGALQRAFLRKKITNEGEIMKKLALIAEEQDKMERAMQKEVDDLLLRKRRDAMGEIQSLLAMGDHDRLHEILAELPLGERQLIAQKLNIQVASPDAIEQQNNNMSRRFLSEFTQKGLVSSESRKSFASSRLSMDMHMPGAGIGARIDSTIFGIMQGNNPAPIPGPTDLNVPLSSTEPNFATTLSKASTLSMRQDTSSEDSLSKYMPKSQSHVSLNVLNASANAAPIPSSNLQPQMAPVPRQGISITAFSPERNGNRLREAQPPDAQTVSVPSGANMPALTIESLLQRKKGESPVAQSATVDSTPSAQQSVGNMGISKDSDNATVPTNTTSVPADNVSGGTKLDTWFFSPQTTLGDGAMEDSLSSSGIMNGSGFNV